MIKGENIKIFTSDIIFTVLKDNILVKEKRIFLLTQDIIFTAKNIILWSKGVAYKY